MKRLGLVLVAPVTLLAGCGGADTAETVDAVRATEHSQLQSIASDDLVGIARLYTDDAVLVRPDGSVLDGAQAIVEQYADLVEDPNFALTIEPRGGWASSASDLAVLTSDVEFTTTDPDTGEANLLPMTSQTVWRRESGGTWKIVSSYNVARAGAAQPEAGADSASEPAA